MICLQAYDVLMDGDTLVIANSTKTGLKTCTNEHQEIRKVEMEQ